MPVTQRTGAHGAARGQRPRSRRARVWVPKCGSHRRLSQSGAGARVVCSNTALRGEACASRSRANVRTECCRTAARVSYWSLGTRNQDGLDLKQRTRLPLKEQSAARVPDSRKNAPVYTHGPGAVRKRMERSSLSAPRRFPINPTGQLGGVAASSHERWLTRDSAGLRTRRSVLRGGRMACATIPSAPSGAMQQVDCQSGQGASGDMTYEGRFRLLLGRGC